MAKRPGKAKRGQAKRDWQDGQELIQAKITANKAAGLSKRSEVHRIGDKSFSQGFKTPSYDFKSRTHKQPYIPFHNGQVSGKVVRGHIVPRKSKSVTSDKDHYKDTTVTHMNPVFRPVLNDEGVPMTDKRGKPLRELDHVQLRQENTLERGRLDVHGGAQSEPMAKVGVNKSGKSRYKIVGKPDTVPNKG